MDTTELTKGHYPGKKIATDIISPLPTVYGDRVQLYEIFQNLLDNAAKFMGEQDQPRIEIGTCIKDHEPACFVWDNGIGIESKFNRKIFGLFDRLDQSYEGTGIGRAIVNRVIEPMADGSGSNRMDWDVAALFILHYARNKPRRRRSVRQPLPGKIGGLC